MHRHSKNRHIALTAPAACADVMGKPGVAFNHVTIFLLRYRLSATQGIGKKWDMPFEGRGEFLNSVALGNTG